MGNWYVGLSRAQQGAVSGLRRIVGTFVGRGAAAALFVALAVLPVMEQECSAAPSNGDLQKEIERARERRTDPVSEKAEDLGDPISWAEVTSLPPNYLGQTNPAAAIGNVLVDTAMEVANFPQCFDWKLLPGCWCGKLIFGVPIPLFPAYEYRWPMVRYEITRQPFMSVYWPNIFMNGLQEITLEPAVALLVKMDFSTMILSLVSRGLRVSKPKVSLDFIKNLVTLSFQKIPNPGDNKARGGGLQSGGTTQTSVHGMPSPARYSPLSDILQVLTIFGPVRSHIRDGFRASPMPDWTESPRLMPYARSPGRSAYISGAKELSDMWTRLLSDARACVRFNMKQQEEYFRDNGPTVGMVPHLINAGSGEVKPSEHPCLRFGNIKWFPFDFHLNVSSEPMAAWVSMVKMAKLMSVTRGSSGSVRNWSDMYDLVDDKAQYLRGEDLTGGSFQCTDIEKPYEEFGSANTLEHEANPIMITHWKRYSGCPPSYILIGSCPRSKISRQSRFNPEVKNSTRTP